MDTLYVTTFTILVLPVMAAMSAAWLVLTRNELIFPITVAAVYFILYAGHFLVFGTQHRLYAIVNADSIPIAAALASANITLVLLFYTISICAFRRRPVGYQISRKVPRGRVCGHSLERVTSADLLVLALLAACAFSVLGIWLTGSPGEFGRSLLGARGTRFWEFELVNQGSPLRALARHFLGAAAILAGAAVAYARRSDVRVVATGVVTGLALLFAATGSRTPFIYAAGSIALIALMDKKWRRVRWRVFVQRMTQFMVFAVLSIGTIYVFAVRGVGLGEMKIPHLTELIIRPENGPLDDNFPRFVLVVDRLRAGVQLADWQEYALASLFNFIPRAVWEAKPVLGAAFWANFKESYWTTVTMLGEFYAVSGFVIGSAMFVLVNVIVGLIINHLLAIRNYYLQEKLLVVCVLLWWVMVLRSGLNFTQAVYGPALAVIIVFIYRRWKYRLKKIL